MYLMDDCGRLVISENIMETLMEKYLEEEDLFSVLEEI
jgi:hypothetical protein